MATHFSVLAWEIPMTEEPGRLQPIGSQSQTRLSVYIYIYCFSDTLSFFLNFYMMTGEVTFLKLGFSQAIDDVICQK